MSADCQWHKKFVLGVVLEVEPDDGGAFYQAQNMVSMLLDEKNALPCEVVVYSTRDATIECLARHGLNIRKIKRGLLRKQLDLVVRNLRSVFWKKIFYKILGASAFERYVIKEKLDLVYFLAPSGLARDLVSTNYIFTVWDLCHREQPEFPEVRDAYEIQRRDELLHDVLPRAAAVIADSERNKSMLASIYGLFPERVHVVPFSPARFSGDITFNDATQNNNLLNDATERPFIFYPAQFWPHKNHKYIIMAMSKLKEKGHLNFDAVFVGKDRGNLVYLKELSVKFQLQENVKFLGKVDESLMGHFYETCSAVVMPTFFGPTNLPPLEAMKYRKPLVYSKLPGFDKQGYSNAYYVDLADPRSLCDALDGIFLENPKCAPSMDCDTSNSQAFITVKSILDQFLLRRSCWRGVE